MNDPRPSKVPGAPIPTSPQVRAGLPTGAVPPPPGVRAGTDGKSPTGGYWKLAALGVLAAVGGWFFLHHGSHDEKSSPNWQLVEKATSLHQWVDANGQPVAVPATGANDQSSAKTAAIQAALQQKDPDAVLDTLKENNPKSGLGSVQIDSSVATALAQNPPKEEPKMVEIELFDSCDEDGDQVDISVDGVHYGQVLLSNAGSRLAIPVLKGGSKLEITGLEDGAGGGITVGLRTSTGISLAPVLTRGEKMTVDLRVE